MIVEYTKQIGETMTDLLNRFKIEYNINNMTKVAFAGRLDPLAFGIVIILTDDDIYKKDTFCNYKKTYQCNMIEGITTDTFDIMGLINSSDLQFNNIYNEIKDMEICMEYPLYSSCNVVDINGVKRQSWYCAKNNISIKSVPTKDIILYSGIKLDSYNKSSIMLYNIIEERINMVQKKTFRQDEILNRWKELLMKENKDYTISKWEFKISSGGYIRFLGNSMNGCCFDINRIEYLL